MIFPACTLCGFELNSHFHSDWGKRVCDKVKFSTYAFPRRDCAIAACRAKHVERHFDLRKNRVPEEQGEIVVRGSERCEEMVLESANGAFGTVGTMIVWRNELDGEVVC